jgi:hypothetical protein
MVEAPAIKVIFVNVEGVGLASQARPSEAVESE